MKNRRIELRVSDDEYEDLKLRASQGDLTVSQYIRKGLALGDGMGQVMVEGERSRRIIQTPKTIDGVKDDLAKLNPAPKVVREALEQPPAPTAVSSEMDQKRFKQLVAQLQARMPKDEAEEVARKRLGME